MQPDIITQVAFARGRVLHAATGEPLLGDVEITAEEGPILSNVVADGVFCLSGNLEILFPDLASTYHLHLVVKGRSRQFKSGSAVRLILLDIPAGPSFDPAPPNAPRPLIDMGNILLPADPINLRGRVTDAQNPGTPIPGATIEVLPTIGVVAPAIANALGDYRFPPTVLVGPSQIRCSAAGFATITRQLQLNLEAPVHTENFNLSVP